MALGWLWWRLGPVSRPCRRGTLRGRRGAWRHPPSLCVAGVALGDIDPPLCVAGVALMALGWLWWRAWWQAWRLATSTFFCVAGVALMALGWLWWRAWGPLVARDAAALCVACVAGVALGDIHCHFAWQAWHLATPTFVLRGRRGACGTGLPLVACLGPVGRPVTPRHFAWQLWHTSTVTLRGRRGTWRHRRSLCLWQAFSFCVAGMALMARGTLWHSGESCFAVP